MTMRVAKGTTRSRRSGAPDVRRVRSRTREATGFRQGSTPSRATPAATDEEAGRQVGSRGFARYAAARNSYRWCSP